MYNLADIIRFNQRRGLSFPSSSIAHKYISQSDKPLLGPARGRPALKVLSALVNPVDFNLLSTIVADVKADPIPKDYFSIHLRLGDLTGRVPFESYIYLIKKHELDSKYKGATLFWGIHNNKGAKKSTEYMDNLTRAIKRLGLKVSIRSDEVDEDLKSMVDSPALILSVGGFSWLAGSLNSNHVIWDHQDPPLFPWVDRSRKGTPRRLKQALSGYNYHLDRLHPPTCKRCSTAYRLRLLQRKAEIAKLKVEEETYRLHAEKLIKLADTARDEWNFALGSL